jgi:hypothetical protein
MPQGYIICTLPVLFVVVKIIIEDAFVEVQDVMKCLSSLKSVHVACMVVYMFAFLN